MPSRDVKVMVINRGLEERTSASGRKRHTVRIDASPVIINVDPKTLGKPVAEGIAEALRKAVRDISEVASPSTLLKRKYAATAFSKGKSWAMKRYSGGRIGPIMPNLTDRKFNDSGRFEKGITVNGSENAWRVNVAANRLDEKTAGADGVRRIWNELVRLVPAFADISILFQENPLVRQTLKRVSEERIKIGKKTDKALTYFQAFSALHLRSSGED